MLKELHVASKNFMIVVFPFSSKIRTFTSSFKESVLLTRLEEFSNLIVLFLAKKYLR
jgi:hypothetical protein